MKKLNISKDVRYTYDNPYYYVSTGLRDKFFTIRSKFEEFINRERTVERDYFVESLANDPEKALKKIEDFERKHNVVVHGKDSLERDLGKINKYEVDHTIIPFGKYQGQRITEIDDIGYLYWLWSNLAGKKHEKLKQNIEYEIGDYIKKVKKEEEDQNKKREKRQEEWKKEFDWLINFLEDQSWSNFCQDIAKSLSKGEDISDKAWGIVADIYGKNKEGRTKRNTKQYKELQKDFWKQVDKIRDKFEKMER